MVVQGRAARQIRDLAEIRGSPPSQPSKENLLQESRATSTLQQIDGTSTVRSNSVEMAAVMSPNDPLQSSTNGGAAGSKRKRWAGYSFTIHITVILMLMFVYSLSLPRSLSPEGAKGRSAPAAAAPRVYDVDPERKRERERQLAIRQAEEELAGQAGTVKVREDPKVEVQRMAATTKAGGAYMPPHRMRAIMGETAALQGSASPEFQRMSWDALRKSINGLINKINVANIKQIIPELFGENLIRGRGLYCRSMMRAQAASLPFTPVFAAMTAIVNTKLPQVGELLLTRLISQFRRSFKRNDKVCLPFFISRPRHLLTRLTSPRASQQLPSSPSSSISK